MKNVVITGATGYIGRHVVKKISKYPDLFNVVVASRKNEFSKIKFCEFNLDKNAEAKMLYEKMGKPDICIHLAWSDGFIHNSIKHINDLPKHFNFLRNLADCGTKQFIIAGSFREYGSINGMADETILVKPNNLYTLSKITLKNALEIYFSNKNICLQWIRPFSVYGDDENNNSIFTKIIRLEQSGVKTFPFTYGNEKYDFINIDELATQIVAIATQTDVDGVIDCCTGIPETLGNKVEKFLKQNSYKIRPEYGAFPHRKYDSMMIYGNVKKINKIMESFRAQFKNR